MKRFIGAAIALALSATVLSATPAVADRYSDAETAHLLGRYNTARRLLLPLARKGDKRAQYLLGRQYQLGQGVAKDPVRAYVWYSRAAKQGHAEAGLFKHLLVSKWKMSPSQVARAKAILAGKKPTVVASVKPTATATATPKPRAAAPDRKGKTTARTDDFGPAGPDPRGRTHDDETQPRKNLPTKKDAAEKAPAAKSTGDKKPVAKDPPRKAPVDRPSPRSTAKVVPKTIEPTDEEILRREREADRKAEARRRQQEAERQEIEARQRAEAFRREQEQETRAPYAPEEDRPPVVEGWMPAPPVAPYVYRPHYPRNFRPYYAPPARVYSHRMYPRGAYRAPPRAAGRYRYRNNWRLQRRAWRRHYNRRGYNRRR